MNEVTQKNDQKTEGEAPPKSGNGNASPEKTEEQLFFNFDDNSRGKRTPEEVVSEENP